MIECRLSRRQSIGLTVFLAAALLAAAACCVVRLFDVATKDYAEGHLLAVVERMQRQPISTTWLEGPPYTLNCYGPLYYWVVAAIAPLTPWDHGLVPGRLVSFLATLATAGLVGVIVGRETKSVELGMVSALICLSSRIAWGWGIRYRVDALAVLFSIAAYWAVGLRRGGIPGSAVLLALGSLVKQTAALSALPIFVHLLLCKRHKDAAMFALLVAALGIVPWLAVDWASGGYFASTGLRDNLLPMVPTQALKNTHIFLCAPIAVAAFLAVAWLFVTEPSRAIGSLYCLAFVVSAAVAGAMSARIGSNTNYFLEASALGAIVIGCYGLCPLWRVHRGRSGAVAALLTIMLLWHTAGYFQKHPERLHGLPPGPCEIADLLDTPPGEHVLADGQCIDVVFHARRRPLVNDPLLFSYLVRKGTQEPGRLVRAMERCEVKNLVMRYPVEWHRKQSGFNRFWPTEILDAMQRCYVLQAVEGDNLIYRHRRAERPSLVQRHPKKDHPPRR